jgi:hypothetical protein
MFIKADFIMHLHRVIKMPEYFLSSIFTGLDQIFVLSSIVQRDYAGTVPSGHAIANGGADCST